MLVGMSGVQAVEAGALELQLRRLRAAVAALRFALSGARQAERRAQALRIAADLDADLARLADVEAPLLVVLGGVTGAGKSTTVNTLVGQRIVATGVLRPTTYAPTLVVAPDDAAAFAGDRVLGDLPRAEGPAEIPAGGDRDTGVLRLVRVDTLTPGLALLDAPDVDSVSSANRDLADTLLDAADLWLWFTTAGKYADAESMRYLRRAGRRRTALAVVLAQVHAGDAAEILPDFRTKLAAEGLEGVRVFVIPFATVTGGLLPPEAIADLSGWLSSLGDPETRAAFRRQTLEGAVAALPDEVAPVLAALQAEVAAAGDLAADVDRAYADARSAFSDALDQGLPLTAEVVGRWDRFVGSGRLLQLAEAAGGRARAWLQESLFGGTAGAEQRLEREVRAEVGDTIADLVVQLGELAASDVVDRWERAPEGRVLLAAVPDLQRGGDDLRARAEAAVRDWQDEVAQLVATKGAERRTTARWVSGTVTALATVAIGVAFAHTGGLTGAEAGIAGAAGAANQALLVRLLGEGNLRWLLAEARSDLSARFATLMDDERRRRLAVLADAAPSPDEVAELSAAVAAVERAGAR